MNNFTAKALDILGRIVATFVVSALGIISGAAILVPDVSVLQSALLAGFVSCAHVIEKLARASLDGTLSLEEINDVFDGEEDEEESA